MDERGKRAASLTLEQRRARQAAYQRAYWERHRERLLPVHAERQSRRRVEKRASVQAAEKRWRAKNPEKCRAHERRKGIKKLVANKTAEKRLLERVYAVIPRTMGAELRLELVSMLFEAIYSGRFPRRVTPEHARTLMTEHFRRFSSYGPISLDAARFNDGGGSLHDTISTGLWQ